MVEKIPFIDNLADHFTKKFTGRVFFMVTGMTWVLDVHLVSLEA